MLEKDLEVGKYYVFERERIKYIGINYPAIYKKGTFINDRGFANKDFYTFVFRMDNGRIIEFDSLQAIHEFNKEKDKH